MPRKITLPQEADPAYRLADIVEVAALVGVDARTIQRWDKMGSMPPSHKHGGTKRWRLLEIQRWIDAGIPDLRAPHGSFHFTTGIIGALTDH